MADNHIHYRPLGRQALRYDSFIAGSATRVRLLLGPDHLLLIEKLWFKESYRRFYYKDIQAFLMLKTNRWLWWNLGWLFMALLFVLSGFLSSGSDAAYVFFGLAAVFAFLLGINWAIGQSCRCYLKTAVQYEELTPLNRARKAEKALARLSAEIELVQGRESPVTTTSSEPMAQAPASPPEAPPAA